MYFKKIVFFISLLAFSNLTLAQDGGKDFKTKSISIFKNGSAFLVKSGSIKTDKGVYRMTDNIPSALYGSFWFHSPSDKLKYVTSFTDQIIHKSQNRAASFLEMLDINIGKKVRLHLGTEEIVEGTVEDVEKITTTVQNPPALPVKFSLNSIITFRSADKWLTFHSNEIRRIEFLEKPNQLVERKTTTNKPVLQLDFSNSSNKQNVDMMYLANGLSWTPIYLIELVDEKKARLTLRAEVVNNLEDINNTNLNFVVGVPNFRYANRLSSLVDFFSNYVAVQDQARFSNSMLNVQVNSYEITEEDSGFDGFVDNSNPALGSAEEDLFFYQLKDFSLKQGARGHFPIFQVPIEIDHIYESNLLANNAQQRHFQDDFLFNPDERNVVYHSIRINNDTQTPWTTGTAMVVKGIKNPKPISQDRLNYTPIKGHSFVKLTEAPDVKIKHAERQLSRQEKAMRNPQNKNYYLDLVTVEGQVKIKNYKAKDIKLNVRRLITGELLESDMEWLKTEKVIRAGQNPVTHVCWETEIKAGEELVITYGYKVYVPD